MTSIFMPVTIHTTNRTPTATTMKSVIAWCIGGSPDGLDPCADRSRSARRGACRTAKSLPERGLGAPCCARKRPQAFTQSGRSARSGLQPAHVLRDALLELAERSAEARRAQPIHARLGEGL